MGKVVESALKLFVATVLVVTGIGFLAGSFAAGTTFWAAMTTSISFLGGISAVGMATLSAVTTLIGGLLSGSPDAVSANFGTKLSTRDPASPRQLIYGKCRVGGTITHIQTSGTDNHLLSFVVVIAGHEVDGLEDVIVNDEFLTTTSSGGFQVATNSKFTNTDNDNNFGSGRLLRFKFIDGSQTAADSTVTSNSSLGSTDKFIGCAYAFFQVVFDPEKFGGGLPNISFVVRGKKCFDPRDSSTSFTHNPALMVRDYLTDTTYGIKATSDEILDTAALGGFISAANTCDSSTTTTTATTAAAASNATVVRVTSALSNNLISVGDLVTGTGISGTVKVVRRRILPNGSGQQNITLDTAVSVGSGVTLSFGQPEYVADGFTNFSGTGESILTGILSSCSGKLSFVNGKFVMFAGATVTADMNIGDDDVFAPFKITTKSNGAENYNTAKAVYVDSNAGYQPTDTPVFTSATHLANDTPTGESSANYRNMLEMQLPFTNSVTNAQRLVKQNLLYSRQDTMISTIVPIRYMQLQPHDYVTVTNSRLGYTNKLFEVMSLAIEPQTSDDNVMLACNIALKEIDASVYNFLSSDYINPEDIGIEDETGDLSLDPPSNLALTSQIESEGQTFKVNVQAAWTNLVSDRVQGTEVQYKKSTDSEYTGDITVGKGVSKAIIPNLVIGNTYNVRVRHFDSNGINSAYTSAVNIAIADPTSISAPTNFAAEGDGDGPVGGIRLSWRNPNNQELKDIKIYRHTSNFTPTDDTYLNQVIPAARPLQTQFAFQSLFDGISAGTTYFFALRAVSTLGVESSFTSVVSASFVFGKENIGLNNVTNHTQIKDDGSNAPNILKNDQLSISKVNGQLRFGNTGSNTDIGFTNSDVGLPLVTNHAQVKDDLTNFSFLADDFEVDSGSFKAKNALKNAQISISSGGVLSGAGGGTVSAVGIGAIKTDISNAPNSIKNNQISISSAGALSGAGGGTVTASGISAIETGLGNAPSTIINSNTTKADVGLSQVTNDAQVKDDLSNLSLVSDDFEVDSGNLKAKNALKNAQISISAGGVLSGAGGGTVSASGLGAVKTDLTNAPSTIVNSNTTKADVGLSQVTNDAQVKDDLSNLTIASADLEVSSGTLQAKNALKNAQISISSAGVLSGAGGGTVSASGLGAVKTDLTNAPTTIVNSNTTKADVGLDQVTNHAQVKDDLSNLSIASADLQVSGGELQAKSALKNNQISISSGGVLSGAGGGTVSATGIGAIKTDASNAPNSLKNNQITLGLSGTSLSLNNAGSGTQTLSKTNVGLSDLNSLESGAGTKLSGIEANATFGAVLGSGGSGGGNLLDENDNNLTDAIVITSQGTSNDTNNVNSVAKADVTSAITGTQTNVASIVSGLSSGSQSVSANSLNAGEINTSLLRLDELFLPTEGTATSGQTVNFSSVMTQVSLGSIGDGAGFYMGTISVQITDAQSDDIRGASFHIDLKSGSSTVYTKYWPIGIKEGNQYYDAGDQFGDNNDLPVMHLEFGYFHTSNTALNLFVNADSNDTMTTCLVKARAVRFGAETVTFNPTSVAGATVAASTDNTFSAVTVSGFTGTKAVNLSGNSSALVSVNSGSFVNSSIPAISANQTFQVKMTSSATAGAVRTATIEIGGTAITFTLTTTGTYTPTYSGGGGGGSAGGGFENTTQLN